MAFKKWEKISFVGYFSIVILTILFFINLVYAQTLSLNIIEIDVPLKSIEEVNSVIDFEDESFIQTEKYSFVPEYTLNEISYTTHEYETPKGERGYQIIIEDDISVKSINYGPEIFRDFEIEKTLLITTSTNEKVSY